MAAPRGFSVVVAFLAALALQRAASLPVALEADRLLASAEVAPAGSAAVPRAGLSLFGSGCKSEHLQNLTLGHLINLHFHDDGDRSSKADVPSEIRGDPEGVELTTTTLTITKPKSGAEATGVAKNQAGDLEALIGGLISNLGAVVMMIAIMLYGRRWERRIYENNVVEGWGPQLPTDGFFGWMRASMSVSVLEAVPISGLDSALFLEFQKMCMNITASFGLPLLLIIGPINFIFGGGAAGDDTLSYFCINNVQNESPLFWMHALVVWGVVGVVHLHIFRAQKKFMTMRFKWLRELPEPRATSILVEGVPDEYCSDAKLLEFFEDMFGASRVKSAYLAKRAPELRAAFDRKAAAQVNLSKATYSWDQVNRDPNNRPCDHITGEDLIDYYTQEIAESTVDILQEREKAKKELSTPGGVNACNGFVTFFTTADAELAVNLHYSSDALEWVVSTPPPPQSLKWEDLQLEPEEAAEWNLLGYLLTAGLYCIYLPLVLWITNIAMSIHFGIPAVEAMWMSLAPTVGLQFMVCFLPTFLVLIFKATFTLKDDAWAQQVLQNWYFIFQLVFIVLVTAIGPSLFEFMFTLVYEPFAMMTILADTMPFSTHFYINYAILSWTCIGLELTRYMSCTKFFFLRKIFEDDEARAMSEPEDQDYYGMGARYARSTMFMTIAIIYSTISPPVAFFVFITFLWGRTAYGYLVLFGETKKADLGGHFFVQANNHLFIGNIIYVLTMTGILYVRARTGGPATISFLALPYVIFSMFRFETEFQWENLPYEEHKADEQMERLPHSGEYVQPEWRENFTVVGTDSIKDI
mmetsp:Transcript_69559/g.126874  ORF Transcript_69559/g.126874 Transcript_69559/m.126874 type:complete len:810 (-) Transcript_69559:38-2467(-)